MNLNSVQQTVSDIQALYEATVTLYESYFLALEALVQKTPDTEIEKLKQLNTLAEEANEAMQADLAIFDKAVSMDAENVQKMQEQLQIQALYGKLKS